MDLAMNHPVRKLISKFRKMSNMKINVPSNILEEDGTKDDSTVLGGKGPPESRRGSRDKPPFSSSMDFPSRNSGQSAIKSLWKLPPTSEVQDNPCYPTPNNSESQTKSSFSVQVKDTNPLFQTAVESVKSGENEVGAENARRSSTLTSSSTKLSPGTKWGKLLGSSKTSSSDAEQHSKALSALLKPSSNLGDLALKNQSQTNASSLDEDFDKMTFYEMNCCLRNDMMTINNRMGGIDMRLTQILQMLRESMNSGHLPAYLGAAISPPTRSDQTSSEKPAVASGKSGDPTPSQASSSSTASETVRLSKPLTASSSLREDHLSKETTTTSDEPRRGIPSPSPLAISLSTIQASLSPQFQTSVPHQSRAISPHQSSFESTHDSGRMLIPPEPVERRESSAFPINYLSRLKKRREPRASSDV